MSKTAVITFLVIFALCLLAVTPLAGTTFLSLEGISNPANPDYLIYWRWRLPRCLIAFFAGSGFALAGLILQAMFKTPLASPFTLGISSGAALGASLYIRIGAMLGFFLSSSAFYAAFAGSLLSTLLVALFSWRNEFQADKLLLAGISINFLFSGMVMFIQYASNANDAVQIMRWLMGSLSGVDLRQAVLLGSLVLACSIYAFLLVPKLDLITIGEEFAKTKGIDTKDLRLKLFTLTSLLVGVLVSITGPIGFVGMIVPQLCRSFLGYTHRCLLPGAIISGGIFLCLCDLASRIILSPAEVPIGIITSIIGAPFFLWIILRRTNY